MIKKNLFKYVSLFICATLVACNLTACGAKSSVTNSTEVAATTDFSASENTLSDAITSQIPASTDDTEKEETVYVFTDASGNKDHILVNEWLKNPQQLDSISDSTTLTDIKNVKGNETYNNGSNNSVMWNADGNDIVYQGTTSNEAPIDIKVTYTLDGSEITPENLAGKTGNVTMRFDYTNNAKQTITVNGQSEEACVPFTMITGMLLPTDKFYNVTTTNGKVVTQNNSNIVLGITLPGLKDSLNLKFDDADINLDIPEYFEVSAYVTDFELDMTMSAAISNLLTDMSLDDVNLDDVKNSMTDLQDGTDQLVDGTSTLKEGTSTLKEGVTDLKAGASSLNEGASTLNDGLVEYTDGVTTASDGSVTLADGTQTLVNGVNALSDAFKQKDGVVDGVNELTSGAKELSSGMRKLRGSLIGSFGEIKKQRDTYKDAYSSVLKNAATLEKAGASLKTVIDHYNLDDSLYVTPYTDLTSADLTDSSDIQELYKKYMTAYSTVGQMSANAATSPIIDGINSSLSSYGLTLNDIYSNEMGLLLQATANGGVYTALNTVSEGADKKDAETGYDLYDSLDVITQGANDLYGGTLDLQKAVGSFDTVGDNVNTLCSGLYKLQTGSVDLNTGAHDLKDGLATLSSNNDTLKTGAHDLADGASQLYDGTITLTDGVDELDSGALTLKDGMVTLNEDGISKITGMLGDDAEASIDRIKAVLDLGKNYQSFAGKSDNVDGSVKFIYKTAAISK